MQTILKKFEDYEVITSIKVIQEKNIKFVDDARSAAFFAFGKAIRENKSIVLIVKAYEVVDIYTAITEAWFQKTNVIIVALCDNISDCEHTYMDRCVKKTIKITETQLEKLSVDSLIKYRGPVLVDVIKENVLDKKIDYSNIINNINYNDEEKVLYVYNPIDSYEVQNTQIITIDEKYQYGMVSKYLGYQISTSKKCILLCTAECIVKDLNIFNNREINEKIKIIVIDRDNVIEKKHIDQWIISNHLLVEIKEKITQSEIHNFLDGKVNVLVCKEEL